MARFFQAPIVQPMDYGFKLPFQEIMGALKMKQAEQDAVVKTGQGLLEKPLNALAADYDTRENAVTSRQQRIQNLMYDADGNLKDLTGKAGEMNAEARKQFQEEQSGGTWWAAEGSVAQRTKYQEALDKDDKLLSQHKKYLSEASDYIYNEKGGLGTPQGLSGLYTEGQLYQGIKPAAYVDVEKMGDAMGKDAGESAIQVSGVQIDPTTSRVMMTDEGDFKGVDGGRFRQTGVLLTKTYDQIYHATANGLMTNEESLQYMEQEARAIAWGMGNKNPTEDQIQQHIDTRIKNEADRVAHKYMSAKFNPEVYNDWIYQKKVDLANSKAQYDYEQVKEQQVVEVQMATQQNIIDPKVLLDKKTATTNLRQTVLDKLKTYEDSSGKLKPNLATDKNTVELYKSLKAEAAQYQLELDGIKNTEEMILKEGGFNAGTMALSLSQDIGNQYDNTGRMAEAFATYIITGAPNKAQMTPAQKKEAEKTRDLIELYKTDPKAAAATFTDEQLARAEEFAIGNWNKGFEKYIQSIPMTYAGAKEAEIPYNLIKSAYVTSYKNMRDKGIEVTAEALNKTGGITFQSNNTTLGTTGSAATSDLAALNDGMTEEFRKSNYTGLTVSQGVLAGREFKPEILLEGQPEMYADGKIDPKTITMRVISQNVPGIGRGGKPQWEVSGIITDKNGKNPKTVPLALTLSPKASANIVGLRDEAAMQLLETIVTKKSEAASQDQWAIATNLLGGTTDLMYAIHDAGVADLKPNTNREVRDVEGRPLVGVRKTYNKTYQFFEPKIRADGSYYIDWSDTGSIIPDSRANFYNTKKTEWKDIESFQQLVGEKAFDQKMNRKSQDINRQIFLPRYMGDTSSQAGMK